MSPRVANPRRRTLEVRLTDSEWEAVARAAELRSLSKSEFVRGRILAAERVPVSTEGASGGHGEVSEPVGRELPVKASDGPTLYGCPDGHGQATLIPVAVCGECGARVVRV